MGSYQAFQAVRGRISDILKGKETQGKAVRADHPLWYMQMWMPFVTVGSLAKEESCGLSYRAGLYTGIATYPVEPESGQGRYTRPFRSLEE